VERLNPRLNAFVAGDRGGAALAEATRGREGNPGGPLARGRLHWQFGGAQDLFDTRGLRTTPPTRRMYCRAPSPAQDAEVVRRLRAAGAVILANSIWTSSLQLHPPNPVCFGPSRNPVDNAALAGSSSGGCGHRRRGSQDVFCRARLDTGGSIRLSRGLCGHTGAESPVSAGGAGARRVASGMCPSIHAGPDVP